MEMYPSDGFPLPMDGPLVGEDFRPEEKGKRFLLVGGPWGPLFPMSLLPADYYEEEEDPNP